MSGAESGRLAPAKDSRGKGGTIRNLEPPSGSGPDPPEPRGPPLTFQFKIARGNQTLFESTPTEIPSEDLVKLLKLAPGSAVPKPSTFNFQPSTKYALRKGL